MSPKRRHTYGMLSIGRTRCDAGDRFFTTPSRKRCYNSFVSHSMDDIKPICNRVMRIDKHSVMIGKPSDVISNYSKL